MFAHRFLLTNYFWLTASRIATKVFSLLSLPVITFYLSPKDFGIIAMFSVVQVLLSGLFSMGLISYSGRVIYKYERTDMDECRRYLSASFAYTIFFSAIGVFFALLFRENLFALLLADMTLPGQIFYYIPIAGAFISTIGSFISETLLNLQLNKKIFYFEILQFTLFVPVQVIGLAFLKFSIWDVILLQFGANLISTIFGLGLIRNWLSLSSAYILNPGVFKEAMKYSLPFVPLNFAGWIQDRVDRVFLNRINSLSSVGLYTAGFNIASQYSFISRPAATTLKPEISKRLDANDIRIQDDLQNAFTFFFQLSIIVYFAIALFSREIVQLLLNARFFECYRIIPILTLSFLFSELTGFFQLKFIYTNQTVWFPVLVMMSAALNAFLNFSLIPIFDINGAALARTMTELFLLFLTYFIAQHLHRSEYHLFRNFMPLIAVFPIAYCIDYISSSLMMIPVKVCLLAAYGFCVDHYLQQHNRRYRELRGFVLEKAYSVSRNYVFSKESKS